MAGTTHTGAKLHRLAGALEKLPRAGLITVAKVSKRLIEEEARAGGVGTMHVSGKPRGARQEGPTKPRRQVRLGARDTLTDASGRGVLKLQATPVGPWVWANSGTDAHWVGQGKATRRPRKGAAGPARPVGVWVRGRGYGHGVRGPVLHPGTAGKGVWRKAATRVTAAIGETFRDELHDVVEGF